MEFFTPSRSPIDIYGGLHKEDSVLLHGSDGDSGYDDVGVIPWREGSRRTSPAPPSPPVASPLRPCSPAGHNKSGLYIVRSLKGPPDPPVTYRGVHTTIENGLNGHTDLRRERDTRLSTGSSSNMYKGLATVEEVVSTVEDQRRIHRIPRGKLRSRSVESQRKPHSCRNLFSGLYSGVYSEEQMEKRRIQAKDWAKGERLHPEYYPCPYEDCNWEVIHGRLSRSQPRLNIVEPPKVVKRVSFADDPEVTLIESRPKPKISTLGIVRTKSPHLSPSDIDQYINDIKSTVVPQPEVLKTQIYELPKPSTLTGNSLEFVRNVLEQPETAQKLGISKKFKSKLKNWDQIQPLTSTPKIDPIKVHHSALSKTDLQQNEIDFGKHSKLDVFSPITPKQKIIQARNDFFQMNNLNANSNVTSEKRDNRHGKTINGLKHGKDSDKHTNVLENQKLTIEEFNPETILINQAKIRTENHILNLHHDNEIDSRINDPFYHIEPERVLEKHITSLENQNTTNNVSNPKTVWSNQSEMLTTDDQIMNTETRKEILKSSLDELQLLDKSIVSLNSHDLSHVTNKNIDNCEDSGNGSVDYLENDFDWENTCNEYNRSSDNYLNDINDSGNVRSSEKVAVNTDTQCFYLQNKLSNLETSNNIKDMSSTDTHNKDCRHLYSPKSETEFIQSHLFSINQVELPINNNECISSYEENNNKLNENDKNTLTRCNYHECDSKLLNGEAENNLHLQRLPVENEAAVHQKTNNTQTTQKTNFMDDINRLDKFSNFNNLKLMKEEIDKRKLIEEELKRKLASEIEQNREILQHKIKTQNLLKEQKIKEKQLEDESNKRAELERELTKRDLIMETLSKTNTTILDEERNKIRFLQAELQKKIALEESLINKGENVKENETSFEEGLLHNGGRSNFVHIHMQKEDENAYHNLYINTAVISQEPYVTVRRIKVPLSSIQPEHLWSMINAEESTHQKNPKINRPKSLEINPTRTTLPGYPSSIGGSSEWGSNTPSSGCFSATPSPTPSGEKLSRSVTLPTDL